MTVTFVIMPKPKKEIIMKMGGSPATRCQMKDQYDNLANHTQKGIEFSERYSHYVKDRCAIETEYAAKLKRLAKNYQPKKKEEEDYQFSYAKGFLSMLNEVHDIASQHELISENMNSMLTKDMTHLIQELRQERKKHLSEGKDLQKQLDKSLDLLQSSKKQYEKAFKESEKAQESYKQADANINLSRAEVEKQKNISQIKDQQCEEAKSEYACQLQKTNQLQEEHYSVLMPKVFQSLQDMDERRITRIQDFIKTSADIETSVIPIINTCIEGMVRASESVSPSEDSRLVVDRFKSGFHHPGDIPFEDLSGGNGSGSENMNNSLTNLTPRNTIRSEGKGTLSGGKKQKRGGLRGLFGGAKIQLGKSFRGEETKDDYSHLPPTQQKKKLSSKIDQIRQSLAKETAEKDALVKMKEVYGNNPNFGDAASTEVKLEECNQKLIIVRAELKKYEDYLAEAEGKLPAKNGGNSVNRGSYSGDSTISSSASDLSVHSGQPGDPKYSDVQSVGHGSDQGSATDSVDHGATHSSSSQLVEQDSFTDDPDDTLGMCQALYDFVGESDGTISMRANEEYYLIEKDEEESGWTRVRQTIPGGDEGYVPTTYLNLYIP
ncbi:formin-binding protein 1 homolog [Lineus longissimus]|uniref:formin-binding protein 1 homolog n=1 Tax=Lineus longissimus TaxID=88925 RepID=UPI00315D1F0D